MNGTQGKRPKGGKLYSPWFFVVSLIMALVLGRAAYGAYHKRVISASARVSLERELSDLEIRQDSIKKDISRLESPDGIDNELRAKFQVVKPGEEMIVVKTAK